MVYFELDFIILRLTGIGRRTLLRTMTNLNVTVPMLEHFPHAL
jgi:hypothetical protein